MDNGNITYFIEDIKVFEYCNFQFLFQNLQNIIHTTENYYYM